MLRGWFNYFALTQAKTALTHLDEFIRTRCRIVAWSQWKRIRTKYKMLRRLGIEHSKAYQWSNTSKKYARVSHSPILTRSLTNKHLSKLGLYSLAQNFVYKNETQLKFF